LRLKSSAAPQDAKPNWNVISVRVRDNPDLTADLVSDSSIAFTILLRDEVKKILQMSTNMFNDGRE